MLVVVNQPHTSFRIEGDIPVDILDYVGREYGKENIAVINDDENLRKRTARLWAELNNAPILPEHINCEGCRRDGRKTYFCESLCRIRKCAIEKGFDTCGDCPSLETCDAMKNLIASTPSVLRNLKGR